MGQGITGWRLHVVVIFPTPGGPITGFGKLLASL
jgi:hypothetical protein